jgi:hypothetical protein
MSTQIWYHAEMVTASNLMVRALMINYRVKTMIHLITTP